MLGGVLHREEIPSPVAFDREGRFVKTRFVPSVQPAVTSMFFSLQWRPRSLRGKVCFDQSKKRWFRQNELNSQIIAVNCWGCKNASTKIIIKYSRKEEMFWVETNFLLTQFCYLKILLSNHLYLHFMRYLIHEEEDCFCIYWRLTWRFFKAKRDDDDERISSSHAVCSVKMTNPEEKRWWVHTGWENKKKWQKNTF